MSRSEDHESLPGLPILPAAGELGHDDPGLLEIFIWSFDPAGHLGKWQGTPLPTPKCRRRKTVEKRDLESFAPMSKKSLNSFI